MQTPVSSSPNLPFGLTPLPPSVLSSMQPSPGMGGGDILQFPNMQSPMHASGSRSSPPSAAFLPTSYPAYSFGPITPFHPQSVSFGANIFEAPGLHFPSSMQSLLSGGFSRSAQILLESSLSFHSNGLDNIRKNPLKPDYSSYKPSAADSQVMPPPTALALFAHSCLQLGEYRRAEQYFKTALNELSKLKRSAPYVNNPAVQAMNILTSPERDWNLLLVDAFVGCNDEAQAQKVLEQMYNAATNANNLAAIPVKYLLQLARYYSLPPTPTSGAVQQPQFIHNPRAAIAIHTKLIQLQPLAVESALELIKLQVDPRPIVGASFAANFGGAAAIAQGTELRTQCLFLHLLLTAAWNAHSAKYPEALSTEEGGFTFLCSIAPRSCWLLEQRAHASLGFQDSEWAIKGLERIHSIDPYALGSMDLLGLLYLKRDFPSVKEMSTLMAHCLRVDETRHEGWGVAACHASGAGDKDKATTYVEKSLLLLSNTSHKASIRDLSPLSASTPHMIKGSINLEAEKLLLNERILSGSPQAPATPAMDQAIASFRRAMVLAPANSLALMGLASSYLTQAQVNSPTCQGGPAPGLAAHSSYKSALQLVTGAASQPAQKNNPRILTNLGLILSACSEGRQKAAKVLHKAIQLDNEYAESVMALTDMYCASQQYTDAINLLNQYTKKIANYLASGGNQNSANMMLGSRDSFLVKMGQIYVLQGDIEQGMTFFKQALATNPNCSAAIEAMSKIENDAKAALERELDL